MPSLTTKALLATLLALLIGASTATGAPSVRMESGRAVFTDSSTAPNTDHLQVEAVRIDQGTFRYDFYLRTGTLTAIPPCIQALDPRRASCTVGGGTGVDVDLGPAEAPGDGQDVTLKGADWAAGQTTTLVGGPGPDVFYGGFGEDSMNGREGADAFHGGSGRDTVSYAGYAGSGQPVTASIDNQPHSGIGCPARCEGDLIDADVENLVGGGGDDTLVGTPGVNALGGAAGNDTLRGGLGSDSLDGGAGSDTADYSQDDRATGVTVDLGAGSQSAPDRGREDTLSAIENVVATEFADGITGAAGRNLIAAGAGDDRLELVDGTADAAACGAGNDTVHADQGDELSDCEAVTREPGGSPAAGPPPAPGLPCADQPSCEAQVRAIFDAVFGCHDVPSCQQKYPVPGGPGAPPAPCGDPASCGALVAQVFKAVFGCAPEACSPPGGGSPPPGPPGTPAPPCGDRDGCAAMLARVLRERFGCDSPQSCRDAYGGGGGQTPSGPAAPSGPCADPGSCGTYLQGKFREAFGCDTPESCRAKYAGGAPGAPPGGSPPAPGSQPSDQAGRPAGDPQASGSSTGGSPTAARPRRKARRLTVRIRPPRDRRAPYRFVIRGFLERPAGMAQADCAGGRVRVVLKRGKRTLRVRTVALGSDCGYRAKIRMKSRRGLRHVRLRVVARFLGNERLAPERSRSKRVRAG